MKKVSSAHFLFLFSTGIAAVPVRVSSSPRETVVHRSDRQVTELADLTLFYFQYSTYQRRGGEGGGQEDSGNHRVHIFTRDETGLVCLPTQLERTLQLYWWG